MNPINPTVEVIQADREAAVAFFKDRGAAFPALAAQDNPELVQAFARHRLSTSPDRRVREALEKCAAKFREYEAIHAAKKVPPGVGPFDPGGAHEIGQKVIANREMAEMCESALATTVRGSGDEK